jgi:hypothetical protein
MAGNDTAALVVALSAQLTKFEKDLADAGVMADKGVKNIEDRFSKLNPGLGGLGEFKEVLAGLAGGIGLTELITKMQELIEQTAHLGEQAKLVGLTTDQFQQLRYAIVATGASVEAADGFMDRFSRQVSEAARGSGQLYEVFRVNNVALKDGNGQMLSATTLLGKFADLVKNAGSAQDKMNLAVMAGGRQAGPALVAALSAGSEGMNKAAADAEKLGVVMDKELIQRAQEMNEKWQVLKLQAGTTFAEIAVEIADGFRQGYEESGLGALIDGIFDKIGLIKKTPLQLTVHPENTAGDDSTKMFNVQDEEFRKMLERQDQRVKLLQSEQQTIGMTVGAEAQLKAQIQLESEARLANIPLTAERRAAIDAEAAAMGRAAQQLDDYKRRWAGMNSALQFGGAQIVDVLDKVINKTATFGDAMKAMLQTFQKEMLTALVTGQGALAQMLGMASNVPGGTGGILGAFAKMLGVGVPPTAAAGGAISGGAAGAATGIAGFASGTNNAPGGMAMVGEDGPELVNLPRGAQVIPNNVVKNMGGGDINVTLSMDLTGVNGEESMARIAAQAANRALRHAVAISSAAAPGRQLKYNQLGT